MKTFFQYKFLQCVYVEAKFDGFPDRKLNFLVKRIVRLSKGYIQGPGQLKPPKGVKNKFS